MNKHRYGYRIWLIDFRRFELMGLDNATTKR